MSDDLTMLTVDKLIPRGRGLAAAMLRRAASVELAWDVRCKSRFDTVDSSGRRIAVFLPRGSVVRGGDVLVAADGTLLRVVAAPQPVLVVRHGAEHGAPIDLVRAAYHLGNRHVAVELQPDHLKLEPDHVLAAMLKRMHLAVTEASLPFEPEGGAYAAHGHGHDHDHDHEHEHDHDHGQGHAPATASEPGHAAKPAPHVHGPGCKHGHDH